MRILAALYFVVLLTGCPHAPAVLSAATVRAADLPSDPVQLASEAERYYRTGKRVDLENALVVLERLHAQAPTDYDALWHAARAAFWLSDDAGDRNARKAHFAERCLADTKAAIAVDGKRVEAHYYRGICQGLLATTRTLGAIELVGEVQGEGKAAVAADPAFDHAGPERLLGVLYLKAPGWPTSIGDSDEALVHLKTAVQLAGDFASNRLWYADALLSDGKLDDAQRELDAAEKLTLPGAPAVEDPWWARQAAAWKKQSAELRKKLHDKR